MNIVAPASASDVSLSIDQDELDNLDFSTVTFDDNTFDELTITFDTDDPTAVGNLLGNGTFGSGVNSTTTPFLVESSMVEFTANIEAVGGMYTFPYAAINQTGARAIGTVSVTIVDITKPITPRIDSTVSQGQTINLDFGGVMDETDPFNELTITFLAEDLGVDGINLLAQSDFGAGVTASPTTFTVTSQTIEFTARSEATLGSYPFTYTAEDRAGNESSGRITMTITEPDTTKPITPDLTYNVNQSSDILINFNGVTDNRDSIDKLTITFSESSVTNLLTQGDFSIGATLSPETSIYTITNIAIFGYNTLANPAFGQYSFEYTATDRAGNFDTGMLSVNIVALASPTTEDIRVRVNQGETVTFDFSDVIDEVDTFEQLTIIINTDGDGATAGILGNGTFRTGVTGDAPEFTVDATAVTFDVNPRAFATTYTIPYSATDRAEQSSTGNIVMAVADITRPITIPIEATLVQGQSTTLDFSGVMDETDTFDQLHIRLNWGDTNRMIGEFTDGASCDATICTFNLPTVKFIAADAAPIGTHDFIYMAIDRADGAVFVDGMLQFTILAPDTIKPTTPPVEFSISRDATGTIDFGVSDNRYDTFDITFRTDGEGVTGNILDHITFDPNTVNGTTSPFGVTAADGLVRFTVHDDAALETFAFLYTATDAEDNFDIGNVSITFTEADTISPIARPIPATISQNMEGTLDFSIITDNMDTTGQLIITFDTDDPAATPFILRNGTFTSGTNSTDTTPFLVTANDGIVRFTTVSNAQLGMYSIPYTVTDRSGNQDTEMITIIISDGIKPITLDISITQNQRESSIIDFSGVDDNRDSFDELIVFFDTAAESATGGNILEQVSFTSGVNGTSTPFGVTTQRVGFDIDFDAAPGEYSFPYTATDRVGNSDSGMISITIRDVPTPYTPPIMIIVEVLDQLEIVFDFSIVFDTRDSFDQLSIRFNLSPENVQGPAPLLEQGSFTSGVMRTGDEFIVESEMVEFTINTNAVVGVYDFEYEVTDSDNLSDTGSARIVIQNTLDVPGTVIPTTPTTPTTPTSEPAPQPRRSGGGGGSSGGGGGGGGSGGGSSILNIGSFAPHLAMYDQCDTDGKVRVVASAQSNNLQASITSNGKTYTGIDVTDKVDTSKYITTSATPFIFDFETEKLNSFVIKMSIDSSSGISYPVNVDECISHKKLFSNAGVNIATPAQPYFEFGETQDTSAQSNKESQITESVLKQYKQGVPISEIVCQDSANTVLESPSGKPYCMTDSSSATLIDRGYTSV